MDKGDVLYTIFVFLFVFLPLMGGMLYIVSIVDPIANHLETISIRQDNHEKRINNIEDTIVGVTKMSKELKAIRKQLEQIQKERRN